MLCARCGHIATITVCTLYSERRLVASASGVGGAAQEVAHSNDVVHQHDEVQILMGVRLLSEQSIDPPAAG